MLRIWARVMLETKIVLSYIYESIDNFSEEGFRLHIEKLCDELDIPTPMILKTHIKNFEEFGTVTFTANDFVESINFDKLVIENAALTH